MHVKSEKQYMAEDDLRTLLRAEEIKKDPARYKAAMVEAKKQAERLEKVKEKN